MLTPEHASLVRSLTSLAFAACGTLAIGRALLLEYRKDKTDADSRRAHESMVTGLLATITSAVVAAQ